MEQLEMIDKLCRHASADEGISAVLMYGSFTKGEGDCYSDIEFYIFLREGYEINKKEWISCIRHVEMFFTNEFGTDVVVFDNLIRGEFHFHPVSDISIIQTWQGILDFSVRDKMNLVDKDGLLADILNGIEQINPKWNNRENIEWVADSMINNLIFVGNVIRRGEYARAIHLFYFLEKYLVQLIRLHFDNTDHWLDPMKGFENEIPKEWYKRYAVCVPKLGEDDLKRCYTEVIQLTRELFLLLDVPQHDKIILDRIIVGWNYNNK